MTAAAHVRGLALVLLAAACARDEGPGLTRPAVARRDAPFGRVSCDQLGVLAPVPVEMRDDERGAPYQVIVRVRGFPSLAPIDLAPELVVVRGARLAARPAAGEYYFTDCCVALTSAVLFAEGPGAPGPTAKQKQLTSRNPLMLARHAITTCDIFLVEEERLDDAAPGAGVVTDWVTCLPLEGATVRCGSKSAVADKEGRFQLSGTVTWRDLVEGTEVKAAGHRTFRSSPALLNAPWVEHLLAAGEAAYALMPVDEKGRPGSLAPAPHR